MMKLLLNLTPSEPLSLMKKLPCFDEPTEFDNMMEGVLCIGIHDRINYFLFYAGRIEFSRGKLFIFIQSVQERWKIWSVQFHIKYWVQSRE